MQTTRNLMLPKVSWIIGCLIFITAMGCTRSKGDFATELSHFINQKDNGLVKQQSLENGEIRVVYLPPSFYALRSQHFALKDTAMFERQLKQYEQQHSFLVKVDLTQAMSIKDQTSSQVRWGDFMERVLHGDYSAFRLVFPDLSQRNPTFCHPYTSVRGRSEYQFMVSFPESPEDKNWQTFKLQIHNELIESDGIIFDFYVSDINSVPKFES